jgi:hypothetical protein
MKEKDLLAKATKYAFPDIEGVRREIVNSTPKKRSFAITRFAPAAACLVVIIAAVVAFPYISNPSTEGPQSNPPGNASATENGYPSDTAMLGLPVENFNLSDVQDGGASMNRIAFYDFGSLFQWGVDSFAVVKVGDTQTVKDGDGSPFERQMSRVRVLKSIYGDCKSETLQVSQSVIKDHFCLGTTNLLREGAVYLLPLKQYDDHWYISGDMDVLFEIDDKGVVWSHSGHEDFNQYDGKDVGYFIDRLQTLISNDDFMLANSPLSNILQSWTLADITITAKSDALPDEYGDYHNYSFTVNEVLSVPANPDTDRLGATGSIMVYADEDAEIKLTPGSRYLLCLDCYEGKINANSRMISEIKDDGAIRVIPANDNNSILGESVFTPYDGYTVLEIKDLISRIHSWQESNQ